MRAAVQGILNSCMGERVQMKKELFAGMELFLGRKQLLCIGAGLILGIMGQVSQAMNSSQDSLERPGIGQEETRELLVEGLMEEEALPVEIDLSPRQYREEEALRVYEDILEELPGRILGENTSLMEIRQDLELMRELPEYGVSLEWKPENPELLDAKGRIQREALGDQPETMWLFLQMTDGHNPADYQFRICLMPEEESQQEKLAEGFQERLKEEDYKQRYSPVLTLPREYEGHSLSYKKVQEPVLPSAVFLGIAGALLLVVKERSDRQKQQQQRKRQLLSDYPELLTKMMIFLGAGMTVRTAWEQIAEDYHRLLGQKRREKRWVYEEMYETSCQMKRGVPEGQAFAEFGRRCSLPCYTKFAGYLEQSRKNGSKNLRELLRLEMEEAFEQRKHQARRLGEEASTKLLLPLFLMLGVVMIMVAVPAMLEFM